MYPSLFGYVSDSLFDIENTEKDPQKCAPNTGLRLTHVREGKLAVLPFRLFRYLGIADWGGFLHTIGSFLLTVELLCFQLCFGAFAPSLSFFTYSSHVFAYS